MTTKSVRGCPFCDIVAGRVPAEIVRELLGEIVIKPLEPVTPGHLLVIPRMHLADATTDPVRTGWAFRAASDIAADVGPCNLITSIGAPATQTVFHLHVHVVPRAYDDGLSLPWTPTSCQESA